MLAISTEERKNEILNGELSFPIQIRDMILEEIENVEEQSTILTNIDTFWNDLWYAFLKEKGISTEVYAEKFDNPEIFNKLLYLLSKAKWIESKVESNYGTITLLKDKILKWVSKEELKDIMFKYRMNKYKLTNKVKNTDNLVKLNNKVVKSGIIRKGFAKAVNNTFKYDTITMKEYVYEIANNILKGLDVDTKDISYEDIVLELLAIIANENKTYSLNENISDSRGRSIFQCQKKVANPISSKDMRALIIIPSERISILDRETLNSIFSFIAELNGYKGIGETYINKVNKGIEYFQNNIIIPEAKGENLYEHIWLVRIYNKLDTLFKNNYVYWDIPIEIDATASMLQFIGILTNNHEYMEKTNMIGDTLADIWTIKGLQRNQVKKVFTPHIYGSGKSPKELLDGNKIEYTTEQLNKLNNLLHEGLFMDAESFKNYIISNVNPKFEMNIKILNDSFKIECNRFKWGVTSGTKIYKVYTSKQDLIKRITREIQQVPDLESFKRYFVTLLIHNLDSQVANNICEKFNGWIIPNHDAFLVHPLYANTVKEIYTSEIYNIYTKRHDILKEYFDCIGIEYTNMDINKTELNYDDFNINTILK